MKTFFHAFQVRDRTLVKAKEDFDSLGGSEGGGDGDSSDAMLSSGFQKRASFLLLLIVASTLCLLQIPHTVTFCSL